MKIYIREYENSDCEAVAELFYETVHNVNIADYTAEQASAWATGADSLTSRREDLLKQRTLIAEVEGETVGFGSLDNCGVLDLLFVRKDFLRRGIASALCDELEKGFSVITTYSSVTARPFFEKRGYAAVEEREAERLGVKLKNFKMEKIIKRRSD